MPLLIALTCYLLTQFRSSTGAALPPSATPLTQLFPREDPAGDTNPANERHLISIIWNCLTTIFLCTWVSVHQNVPPQEDSRATKLGRRLQAMVWTLIVPELTLALAARQHFSARRVAKTFHDQGWTMTHGFFLIMGGFRLYRGDMDLGVLCSADQIQHLHEADEIDLPYGPEFLEEIEDKSKADGLTKLITVVQTFWFILQCATRLLQHLELTKLEIITLALASLNGLVFLLWLKKPLNVQHHIKLYLKQPAPTPARSIRTTERSDTKESFDQESKASSEDRALNKALEAIQDSILSYGKETKEFLLAFTIPERDVFDDAIRWYFWCELHTVFEPLTSHLGSRETGPWINSVSAYYDGMETPPTKRELTVIYAILAIVNGLFGALHCIAWYSTFPTDIERDLWRALSFAITIIPVAFLVCASMIIERSTLYIGEAATFIST
ncbi:hypothetical protein NLJ89_g10022 [Agrocybe chaxingu]|uniref:Uncharacterized protein n=1 Tax=Agrocybe chaxingu TaxID=84603 RepID=A0A9W8JRJ8_9AGAR|nr:hypothetical protein NLJ89_g10022 [Agrocybe chaxingu]